MYNCDISPRRRCSFCGEDYSDNSGHDYEECVKRLNSRTCEAHKRVTELQRALGKAYRRCDVRRREKAAEEAESEKAKARRIVLREIDFAEAERRVFERQVMAELKSLPLRNTRISAEEARRDARTANEVDGDIHAETAAEMFCVPLDRVTSEMRHVAKVVNFNHMYSGPVPEVPVRDLYNPHDGEFYLYCAEATNECG